MNIIDTHAHLDHIEDLGRALENADKEGVESIVAVSVDVASCQKNLDIKKNTKKPNIYLAMGMHPSDINLDDLDACVELIRKERSELTAIGEIGLDFWYKWVRKDSEKKNAQRKALRILLELAKELDLPAVVHTRGTWRECFQIVREVGVERCEFHWYSGPRDVLRDILDSGYYISASPSLAYSPQSREAVSYAPIERVMIETDSPVFYSAGKHNPFLTARKSFSAQQRRNDERSEEFSCRTEDHEKEGNVSEGFLAEPKDILRTLKAYCMLKNVEEAYALEIFNRNAKEFFHIN